MDVEGDGTIEVVVILTTEAAREAARAGSAAIAEVNAEAARLGVALEPQHPGASGPETIRYRRALVADEALARDLVEALRGLDAVDGAYAKPPASLPGTD